MTQRGSGFAHFFCHTTKQMGERKRCKGLRPLTPRGVTRLAHSVRLSSDRRPDLCPPAADGFEGLRYSCILYCRLRKTYLCTSQSKSLTYPVLADYGNRYDKTLMSVLNKTVIETSETSIRVANLHLLLVNFNGFSPAMRRTLRNQPFVRQGSVCRSWCVPRKQ